MDLDLIEFRVADTKDAEAIAQIHDAAWRTTYQGIIPHLFLERMVLRRGPTWWQTQLTCGANITLLSFNGVACGYASWGRARGAWPWLAGEIYELYLTPIFQGVGLGKKLFLHVKHVLRRAGYDKLIVWALENNDLACEFYENRGGKPAASALEHYGSVDLKRIAYLWGAKPPQPPEQ